MATPLFVPPLFVPPLFVPPVPAPPEKSPTLAQTMRAAQTNALQTWPAEAYRLETIVQKSLGQSRFLINGEAEIHRVLVANAKNYRRSPASIRILRPLAGDGLLLAEGEPWRRQRQTIAPALAPRVIPMLARHVVAATQTAIDQIAATPGPTDALATIQRLTLEIASRSLFSLEIDAHGPELRRFLAEFGNRLGRLTLLDFLLPASIPNLRDLQRTLFRRRWTRFMDRVMAERIAAPPTDHPRDLFDLLLAARDPAHASDNTPFTRPQLRDQMATLLLAGHETTALTLFWTLYLVANAPEVQARLAQEAQSLDPDNEATPNLPTLRYTRAVIQEALRLYPPAFTIARAAIAQDQIGDTIIPKNAVVLIAPWVLHRHTKFWPNPAAFDPSRFEGDPQFAHRFAYLPFGAGPRVCVGAQFALTEAILVLAMLMQRFHITFEGTRPVLPAALITTQPDHSPPFRFTPRYERDRP